MSGRHGGGPCVRRWHRQKVDLLAFQHRGRQCAAIDGARVDIGAETAPLGQARRRVAVHHVERQRSLVRQKLLADPDEVMRVLRLQCDAGADAGVHEKVAADALIGGKAVEEGAVGLGQGGLQHRLQCQGIVKELLLLQPVGAARRVAAEGHPAQHRVGVGMGAQHGVFVVATQAQPTAPLARRHQRLDHAVAVGPAVDIVAQKHLRHRACGRAGAHVLVDQVEEALQRFVHPVDVADGVDALPVGKGGRHRRPALRGRAVRGAGGRGGIGGALIPHVLWLFAPRANCPVPTECRTAAGWTTRRRSSYIRR
ncbi:MAG: hypothetical protein AcusKO_30680 [Acuticoccus sp.]